MAWMWRQKYGGFRSWWELFSVSKHNIASKIFFKPIASHAYKYIDTSIVSLQIFFSRLRCKKSRKQWKGWWHRWITYKNNLEVRRSFCLTGWNDWRASQNMSHVTRGKAIPARLLGTGIHIHARAAFSFYLLGTAFLPHSLGTGFSASLGTEFSFWPLGTAFSLYPPGTSIMVWYTRVDGIPEPRNKKHCKNSTAQVSSPCCHFKSLVKGLAVKCY